jgi:hypothetical protein
VKRQDMYAKRETAVQSLCITCRNEGSCAHAAFDSLCAKEAHGTEFGRHVTVLKDYHL